MDVVVALEVSAPLVVALFAVWLGYVYQQRVSDRDLRRHAFVSSIALLVEYSELLQGLEQLSFAASSYIRFLAWSTVNPSEEAEKKLNSLLVRLNTVVSMTGASPDWDSISMAEPEREAKPVNLHLTEAWAQLVRRQNELRMQFNRERLLAMSSTRMGVFHHPQSAIEVLNLLQGTFSLIDREFYSSNNPTSPHPVDWHPIDNALSAAWNLALHDIRIVDHMNFPIGQRRERIPWDDLKIE